MDAPYYNGDDDRDWPSVEDPRCAICGANDDEPCSEDCTCSWCLRDREALRVREIETWIQAANLATAHGDPGMAADCLARARGIAAATDRATRSAA